eukprot:TRINITY_DN491_c0_g1_i2.p1 TRINITY_DN491_c0_g1~~TRINITY_DN491_c0_g1_i2.p1  ORF type:complete len:136 (+),score=25.25 TRINITY_DN491_c0_g1_i2:350-757(+)
MKCCDEELKQYSCCVLDDQVRLIVNTGVGVLESTTTLDGLFYQEFMGKGEYANLMKKEENVDFHLLLKKVGSAKLQQGTRGSYSTYSIRIFDDEERPAVMILVMWKPGTEGEYDEGQVEGFQAVLAKYGEEINFI